MGQLHRMAAAMLLAVPSEAESRGWVLQKIIAMQHDSLVPPETRCLPSD